MTLNLSEHLEPSGLERVEVFDDPMGAAFAIGVHAGPGEPSSRSGETRSTAAAARPTGSR